MTETKVTETLDTLTVIERKVLPALIKESVSSKIMEFTNLQEIEVLRAFQWLSNKNLVKMGKTEEEVIDLDSNGKKYKTEGLPEKKFLRSIEKKPDVFINLEKNLSKEEINACIGMLKKMDAIVIKKEKDGLEFSITKKGTELLKTKTPEESLLEKKFPLTQKDLNSEEKKTVTELLQRKNILKKDKKTTWTATLTNEGRILADQVKEEKNETIEKITPAMLRNKSWKGKKFRSFDVESKVPRKKGGKIHFVNEAVDYIKSIWLEMGFEEMEGNHVQSAFWDLDALFVPQDHPAREMQDTFYLGGEAKLPETILKKVRQVHEDGGNTGSKGWKSVFSTETSKQTLLRTHTTVVSAIKISQLKKEELPKKYFIVGKVFRNESLDWKHLFEFQQVDGIVVDPDGSLAKLKGYLKEFFLKMGYTNVRIRPAHFPYTEPSAEVEAYNPFRKQWVEMGGCGIFRPEVTKTLLGFECPVMAWGLGMERIISSYFEINDLREIYKNDYEKLNSIKTFTK